MSFTSGEVAHIVKCVPVEVTIQHDDFCYTELQVSKDNVTFFLSPRTYILKNKGTQIPCNALVPAYYRLGETWLKIMPRPTETKDPIVIQLDSTGNWSYDSIGDLARSGIYKEEDLSNLCERILFPIERPGIINDIYSQENEGPSPRRSRWFPHENLSEDQVIKLAESA